MLKKIFATMTFRQSQITIAGTLINGAVGAVFYILVARFLGPSNFGLLAVSIATLTLIADSVDLGINTGLIKHVSQYLIPDENKALKFLKLSLELKILIWITVLIIGLILAPVTANIIFNKDELLVPLRLVMIGVGGAMLFSFATSALQAVQKYFIWGFVNIITNLFRLIFIIFFFYFGQLNLFNSLLIYILLPFFGFSLALIFLPSKKIIKEKNEFSVASQLVKYNLWVGIFTIIAALSSRLDTFLTARLLSNYEVGIYGAANQLVQVMPQLIGALGVVAAPKFASFNTFQNMSAYFKKLQLFVLGIAGTGLLILPIAIYLIPRVLGVQYFDSIPSFIILFLAMLIFLISLPVHNSIIFYFGKPQVFVWVSIGHLLLMSFLGFFLISNYGIIGASLTVLTGMIFNLCLPLIWYFLKIRNKSG